MRKFNLFIMSLLVLMVITACGSDDGATEATDETDSKEVLKVGSTPTGPPYTFMNNDTDEMEGIMIDVVNLVGEHLDKEIIIEPMTFATLIQSLDGDKIDLISAGMVITDERAEVINFSDEVFGLGEGLIVHEDNTDITTYDDLEGKRVGTQKSTIYHDLLEEDGIAESIGVYESIGEMLQELSNDRLDAVVADEPVLIYLEENNPNFKTKIIDDYESQLIDEVGLGVAKGNDELLEEVNGVIAKMKEDGSLQEIYEKWNVSWDFE